MSRKFNMKVPSGMFLYIFLFRRINFILFILYESKNSQTMLLRYEFVSSIHMPVRFHIIEITSHEINAICFVLDDK